MVLVAGANDIGVMARRCTQVWREGGATILILWGGERMTSVDTAFLAHRQKLHQKGGRRVVVSLPASPLFRLMGPPAEFVVSRFGRLAPGSTIGTILRVANSGQVIDDLSDDRSILGEVSRNSWVPPRHLFIRRRGDENIHSLED